MRKSRLATLMMNWSFFLEKIRVQPIKKKIILPQRPDEVSLSDHTTKSGLESMTTCS